MGRRLYVGNLPYETGETDLQDLFARAGTVETVKVMRDMATGRARGFAFVEMSTDEEAQKAKIQFTLARPSDDVDFGPDFDKAVIAFQELQRIASGNLRKT